MRLKVRLPDGRIEQITMTSSFRPDPEHCASEEYQKGLITAFGTFLRSQGIELVRLDTVSQVGWELGT